MVGTLQFAKNSLFRESRCFYNRDKLKNYYVIRTLMLKPRILKSISLLTLRLLAEARAKAEILDIFKRT